MSYKEYASKEWVKQEINNPDFEWFPKEDEVTFDAAYTGNLVETSAGSGVYKVLCEGLSAQDVLKYGQTISLQINGEIYTGTVSEYYISDENYWVNYIGNTGFLTDGTDTGEPYLLYGYYRDSNEVYVQWQGDLSTTEFSVGNAIYPQVPNEFIETISYDRFWEMVNNIFSDSSGEVG